MIDVLQVGPTDPISTVAQFGVLGVVLIMLLMGYLWSKPAVDEMRKRQDEERKLWQDEIIPTIRTLARNVETTNRLLRRALETRGIRTDEYDARNDNDIHG